MVEFALVAPVALVLLLGLVVLGVVVMNQVQLTNAVRDGARAAAICGTDFSFTAVLPNGTACTTTGVSAYLAQRVAAVGSGIGAPTVTVVDPSTGATVAAGLAGCHKGDIVSVAVSYAQPLYLPLVSQFLGDAGGSTRTLRATGQATCEQ